MKYRRNFSPLSPLFSTRGRTEFIGQLRFHAQHVLASTSHPEQCRRKMHKCMIASSTVAAGYFCMVLTQQLRWSFAVLAIMHVSVHLGFLFGARMWMYTQDPRLMQESPEMLALLHFFESPAGDVVACCAVISVPSVGVLLALLQKSATAVKVVTAGEIFLGLLLSAVVWTSARSLMRAIDESLRARRDAGSTEPGQPLNQSNGDRALRASRKKIQRLLFTIAQQVVVSDPLLLFVTFSKYGEAAPLLMFGVVLGMTPPIWQMVVVQLFAGRSKVRRSEQNMLRSITGTLLPGSRPSSTGLSMATSMFGRKQQVVPTEESQ